MKNYKNFPKQSCNYLRSLAYSLIEAATAAAKSLQSCLTLCNPIDGSPPGSPVLGFSRQEHWSGLPFPSPMHESEREVTQSCPTLCDPMGCSLPGSSAHGIFQAKVLEWGAIAFSLIEARPCLNELRLQADRRHRQSRQRREKSEHWNCFTVIYCKITASEAWMEALQKV